MKQANNNEIDLLLQSLAKGRDESRFRSGSASAGGNGTFRDQPDHLDADELNSYAEGVVPAAARARYTEHLADCDACRRIVIDLSQAAGAANRFEVPQQQRGAGFWEKLAAIFSPAVLRFGVPALLLTAIIGIGLLAVRQQTGNSDLVAHNQEPAKPPMTSDQRTAAASPGNSIGAAPTTGTKPNEPVAVHDSAADSAPDRARVKKAPELPADADAPPSGFVGGLGSAAKDGPVPAKAGDLAKAAPPPYAPEPKAGAPATAPAPVQTEADEMVTRNAKEQPAKREEQEQRGRDDFGTTQPGVHGPNRGMAQRSGPSNNTQQNAGVFNARGPNADDKKAKAKTDEGETRYVSGRQFARRDNAWVDTAYDSSQATTRVKRGSEQFRALVADEPGIGTLADQLKGVVIVIWKSRAYRIQ